MSKKTSPRKVCIKDVCRAFENIAPLSLAQDWDNVGLLAGDEAATVRRVMHCIDLTHAVVDEAIRKKIDFLHAYHPPLFKPVGSLRKSSDGTDGIVFRCVRKGIAIYSTHTALDAAEGGTNDVIASLCGIRETQPLEYIDEHSANMFKLVVFVPEEKTEEVAGAMFSAGAGHIGHYSNCSYRTFGQGSFFGDPSTKPAVGKKGKMEMVDEVRLETIVSSKDLPQTVTAMLSMHPYDEPAYDIYALQKRPVRGIGRIGDLQRSSSLTQFARKLARATQSKNVQIVGDQAQEINRAIIVVGAAGSLPFRIPLTKNDVIVTGEIRHHDALSIRRKGCCAVALSHWSSERPALQPISERLHNMLPAIQVEISTADCDPLERL